jgi:hypothetical protein
MTSTKYIGMDVHKESISITDGKQWDDKPRWSPDDGQFISFPGAEVFFNVGDSF